MHKIAKALGISVPDARRLFRVPEDADAIAHHKDSLGWHGVMSARHTPRWESTMSVHPEKKTVVYQTGFGKPRTDGSLHTVRSLITARDLGYHKALIHTALGGIVGNGAYTFPRLGFTGRFSAMGFHPEEKRVFYSRPHLEWAHQLVEPAHREWWKQNHKTLRNLHFDLTPGSDSFKRLEGYLRERSASGRPTA